MRGKPATNQNGLVVSSLKPLTLHRITLSARINTFGGIVRPICLAVFRLMIGWNFAGE